MFRSLVLALGLATTALPAFAGSFEYYWTPSTPEERAALESGEMARSISESFGGKGHHDGGGHQSDIHQSGQGHYAEIDQLGSGHSAGITQTGQGNAYAIIQRGRGGTADVSQHGNGEAGILVQYSW